MLLWMTAAHPVHRAMPRLAPRRDTVVDDQGGGATLPSAAARIDASGNGVKRDRWFWLGAAAGGAAIWALVAVASARREAWGAGLYWSVGMPAVCLLSLALGYLHPARSWRWGVAPLIGQFLCMLLMQGPGNLLPVGVLVFAALSLPSILAARIGAFARSRRVSNV